MKDEEYNYGYYGNKKSKLFPKKKYNWFLWWLYGKLIYIPLRKLIQHLTGGNYLPKNVKLEERKWVWNYSFRDKLHKWIWHGKKGLIRNVWWNIHIAGDHNCPHCGDGNWLEMQDINSGYYELMDEGSCEDYTYWGGFMNCPRCSHKEYTNDSN